MQSLEIIKNTAALSVIYPALVVKIIQNRIQNRDFVKIVRIGQNHDNSTPFSTIYPALVVKIVLRIVIFRKILDGDPTKITKMLRNIDHDQIIPEKP